jgi:hypothetical protein
MFYEEIDWTCVKAESDQISEKTYELVANVPELVPFNVRALIFNDYITNERYQHKANRYRLKINRDNIFEDGFHTLSQIDDLRGTLVVTFVNQLGYEEDGQDAGGIFKEFLVQL